MAPPTCRSRSSRPRPRPPASPGPGWSPTKAPRTASSSPNAIAWRRTCKHSWRPDMFRIGEFAQIAQVSGRQLRFYDQLGLLRPAHVDQQTGYRYYTIRQLPRLNSILALKELGLALEQIGPLLEDRISPADLRSMLVLK